MTINPLIQAFVLLFLFFCSGSTQGADAHPDTLWILSRSATHFDRYFLTDPDNLQKVMEGGSLSGRKSDWGITGWFEYDFDVPRTGWYELKVIGSGTDVEYFVDPKLYEQHAGGLYIFGSSGISEGQDKISNLWLDAGSHTLRIQRYYWTGFPQSLSGFAINAAGPSLATSARASFPDTTTIFRKNECRPLDIFTGARIQPAALTIWVKDTSTGVLRKTYSVPIPASAGLMKQEVVLPCNEEGFFLVTFGEGPSAILYRDIRPISYQVINTKAHTSPSKPINKTLVQTIDCVTRPPDYYGGDASRVVNKSLGSYRESGDVGWTRYQRLSELARKIVPEPSWFAYKLNNVIRQQPYLIEVDYPDDAVRTFAIALREADPLAYPVAGGVDSGDEFSLSNRMLTHTLLYWPRAQETRIVFLTAHNGRRAAASKIRVYRVEGALPALEPRSQEGRDFMNWYEEGSNFLSMYGAPAPTVQGETTAIERWLDASAYMGVNTVSPTAAIYSFVLYPSRYNSAFSGRRDDDMLQRMLLLSEKKGMKLIPELHPRADELDWPYAHVHGPKPNLLLSKDGNTNYFATDGKTRNFPPHYNPIYPANQDWYIGMIGELMDNYKDSPALSGVSLRLMDWANPSLNNFSSLEWGYDDYTIDRFQAETGITLPQIASSNADSLPLPYKVQIRYQWLMTSAKQQWIAWRCQKIAQLYRRIRDRVRQARPDLKVYTSVFAMGSGGPLTESLREAGIDVDLLSNIDGIVLVNAAHAYGRREGERASTQMARDFLLNPDFLNALTEPGASGKFLSSASYLEATEVVAPPTRLGFDDATKKTWMSAVANPAGRHFLERYAVELAETDATLLGDGGNAYSLGQPELQEFLKEYRVLPEEHFTPHPDARDPVAVWTLAKSGNYWFYAVNRERFKIQVEMHFLGSGQVRRLLSGELMDTQKNALHVTLQPYELIVFKASGSLAIDKVSTKIEAPELNKVTSQVKWLNSLNEEARNGGLIFTLTKEQHRELQDAAHEASFALNRGWIWRARTIMERRNLLTVYEKMQSYPPYLRDTGENSTASDPH
jgi:hypothetical protein